MSRQRDAVLRCCASCKWIFKMGTFECPQCGFGSYGARFVFGDACYKYAKTQGPWLDDMMFAEESRLRRIIEASQPIEPLSTLFDLR